jgi:glycosyltransferase involved in cell wall biosynthesis
MKDHYKVVLFLGRVTVQKGPDHFLNIAKRISEKDDNVRFIMVGSGDMFTRIVEEAAKMGIGDRVLFSDFLSGKDVERAYKMADVYVMSSVSEPFGLTALEAAQSGTPVVVSKQSGVCEVLKNCLVADFWDVEMMANKILSILNNPEFKKHLSTEGMKEIRHLNWDGAASKCVDVYCKARGGG